MFHQRHERKRLRLDGYDYSGDGFYFVTICAQDREPLFGEARGGIMGLDEIGDIAARFWQNIPDHFVDIHLGEWVIMPNHLHGIVVVGDANLRPLQRKKQQPGFDRSKMLLPKIIQAFKSAVTRQIRQMDPDTTFQWQRSYYDHIVRDEKSLKRISEYIRHNPVKWCEDVENQNNRFSQEQTKKHYDHLFKCP